MGQDAFLCKSQIVIVCVNIVNILTSSIWWAHSLIWNLWVSFCGYDGLDSYGGHPAPCYPAWFKVTFQLHNFVGQLSVIVFIPESPSFNGVISISIYRREPLCVERLLCFKMVTCLFYRGSQTAKAEIHIKQTQTKSGLQCQRWDSQSPHKHKFTDVANFPDANITNAEAFCRSPQAGVYAYPWCFTTDPDTPEENCNVAKLQQGTVYPKKYAHGFVVLCFVVVMQSFIMNSHEVFIHINQGCFAGTGAIVRLP